jgi:ribosomal protein S18 acetylase RimI-like enzyme
MASDATYTIRLATLDDVDTLTELHCACFGPDDHLPVILGKQYIKAMYRWQVSGREAYTVIAESGGEAVAFGGASDGPYVWPMLKACFGQFLMSLVRNPLLLVDRRLWRRLFGSQKAVDKQARGILNRPGVAHLMAGAVDARFRGMGINGAVAEALKAISESRGSKALCVGMRRTNHAVRRVFDKLGWDEVPVSETSDRVHYVTYMDPD